MVSKESLPEDDDSDNEADSESEEDILAIFACEHFVAYFNNPQCNNPPNDDDEWVINDNIIFNYPASVELLESVINSSLACLCINQAQ